MEPCVTNVRLGFSRSTGDTFWLPCNDFPLLGRFDNTIAGGDATVPKFGDHAQFLGWPAFLCKEKRWSNQKRNVENRPRR